MKLYVFWMALKLFAQIAKIEVKMQFFARLCLVGYGMPFSSNYIIGASFVFSKEMTQTPILF